MSNLPVAPKSNDRLNSSSCSSNSFSTNNSKNSQSSLINSSAQIKTEIGIQENSEVNTPFKFKTDEEDKTEAISSAKKSPLLSHQSFSHSKRENNQATPKCLNDPDPSNIPDSSIDIDATHREFYNQLYNQILSSKSPISPPNLTMSFPNNYFLNHLQNTFFKNNLQSQFSNNKDFNNNNNDYINLNLNNYSNHSKSSSSHSTTSSFNSANRESKSCNGN